MAHIYTSPPIRGRVDWKGVVVAGLIAGALITVVEMVLAGLAGVGAWLPPRMVAAVVMGRDVLNHTGGAASVFVTALAVHAVLSILYAAILAWAIERAQADFRMATVAGGVFGLMLYLINFYGFAAVAFPWFADAQGGITLLVHILFGLVLAWAYRSWTARR
ncbi:MAG TPA: hypothetical protein VEB64_11045 [Azospirillaceae bacterium]|nr:hypothetical protein [Azospirillaceae bacterium]